MVGEYGCARCRAEFTWQFTNRNLAPCGVVSICGTSPEIDNTEQLQKTFYDPGELSNGEAHRAR